MPKLIASLFAGLMLLASTAGSALGHSLEYVERQRLKNGNQYRFFERNVPQYDYRDIDGNRVRLDRFKGRIIVLFFTGTNCLNACPAHLKRIAKIQSMVNISPMRDLVQFIPVVIDRNDDTPAAIIEFKARQEPDPANWTFLTTSPGQGQATRRLLRDFGQKIDEDTDPDSTTEAMTHVIDAKGHWRATVTGLKFSSLKFVVYLNALYNDGAGIRDGHGL